MNTLQVFHYTRMTRCNRWTKLGLLSLCALLQHRNLKTAYGIEGIAENRTGCLVLRPVGLALTLDCRL